MFFDDLVGERMNSDEKLVREFWYCPNLLVLIIITSKSLRFGFPNILFSNTGLVIWMYVCMVLTIIASKSLRFRCFPIFYFSTLVLLYIYVCMYIVLVFYHQKILICILLFVLLFFWVFLKIFIWFFFFYQFMCCPFFIKYFWIYDILILKCT